MADINMSEEQASKAAHPLRRILSNASWLTGSQLAGDIANLALFVVIARVYGPEGIGQYAYALGIAGILYAVVNLGLEDLAVRECTRTSSVERGALIGRLLCLQTLALAVSLAILWAYLSIVDHSSEAIFLIVMLVGQQVFFAFSPTLLSPAFADQKMMPAAVARFVTRLFGIIVSLILVLLFEWNLALSLLPLAMGGFLLFSYSVRSCLTECSSLEFSLSRRAIRDVLGKAWPFAGSLALSYLALRSSYIVINVTMGDLATGVYASGMKLMEVAVLPLGFLGMAAYPRLSSLYHSSLYEYHNVSEVLVRVAAIIGIFVSWGLFYIAPYVIVPLLGKRFLDSAPIVQSLAGLALLTSLSFMLVRLLLASDRQYMRLFIQAIMVAVLLVTTLIAVPTLGLNGAILGMYASVLTSVVLTVIVLDSSLRSKLVKSFAQLGFAVVLAVAISFFAGLAFGSAIWPAISSMVIFLLMTMWYGLMSRRFLQ